jgi:gamma-glutamyltranspeptidase
LLAAEGAAFSNVITRYAPDAAVAAASHLAAAAGLAALDRDGNAADAAVAVADACMYRVKASGKAGAAFRVWPGPGELGARPPSGKAARRRSG